MRKTIFANEEYYHIFNRGVDKRNIFMCRQDYERYLIAMDLLNDKEDGLMKIWTNAKRINSKISIEDIAELSSAQREPLVELSVYCLNPNHKHLIMKQLVEGGVQAYMHKLGTSHTNYFNTKYERSGSLFQGPFKSIHIKSNDQLLYVSVYVNKNHFIHGYKEGDNWKYSSLPDYLGKRKNTLCNLNPILDQFNGTKEYEKYAYNNALAMKKKKEETKEYE